MVFKGGDAFDVICIEEAVCLHLVGQVIDVDGKQYQAYDKAFGDTIYGLSSLAQGATDVHLKGLSAEETFDLTYYNWGNAVSFEFSKRELDDRPQYTQAHGGSTHIVTKGGFDCTRAYGLPSATK